MTTRSHTENTVGCESTLPCERCGGSGVINIQYGGDGYGDRCAALADAEAPCPDCTEEQAPCTSNSFTPNAGSHQ